MCLRKSLRVLDPFAWGMLAAALGVSVVVMLAIVSVVRERKRVKR